MSKRSRKDAGGSDDPGQIRRGRELRKTPDQEGGGQGRATVGADESPLVRSYSTELILRRLAQLDPERVAEVHERVCENLGPTIGIDRRRYAVALTLLILDPHNSRFWDLPAAAMLTGSCLACHLLGLVKPDGLL